MSRRPSKTILVAVVVAVAAAVLASAALANNLVYHSRNPSFGGDPNMYAWWFGLADAQSLFKSGGSSGSNGSGTDFGSSIGGPVIVINPGSTTVGSPSTEASVEQVQ
jgi:hypothetical protein